MKRYAVVDLECTCWGREDASRSFHETIEIGLIFLDESFQKTGEMCFFTFPKYHRDLSQYCTDLTGITQGMLNSKGIEFSDAIYQIRQEVGTDEVVLCSWGEFDKKQLIDDCNRWGVDYPFSEEHVNIKEEFAEKTHHKKCGLQKACRLFGLRFNGTPHRGIHDANMAAEVFHRLRKDNAK